MESEDSYVNANVYKAPLKKKMSKAYRMEEESKHCSAPGSQVPAVYSFSLSLTYLTGKGKRFSPVLPLVPLRQRALPQEPRPRCATAALATARGSAGAA